MKLIKQILFLTAVLFLYSCTSTKSVVNCPSFKTGKKTVPKVSKIKTSKTKKKLAFQKRQTKKATRKTQRITKKLNKLQLQSIDRIVDTDIRLPLKEHYNLGKELSVFQRDFKLDDDLQASIANTTKTRVGDKSKSQKSNFKILSETTEPSFPIIRPTKSTSVIKKRFIKKLIKKPQNFGDDKVEPFAIIGLMFSLASLFIFGIPFGITGAILGIIALFKFRNNPNRRGRALAVLAILGGLISVLLVVNYLNGL